MARYDKKRKLERNAMLRRMRQEHPELSLQEIGDAFGISAQRVHQLLSAPGKNGTPKTVTSSGEGNQ